MLAAPYSRRSLAQSRTKLLPDGQADDVPFENKLTSHRLAFGWWRPVRSGLHPPPRSPVRTGVPRSPTNSPQFAGVSDNGGEIIEHQTCRRRVDTHEKPQPPAILCDELGAHAARPRLFRVRDRILEIDDQRVGLPPHPAHRVLANRTDDPVIRSRNQ